MTLFEIASPEANLEAVLDTARERLEECDFVLVLMQKKEGGYVFYAPESLRIETASFIAQQFLHHLHASVEE